MSNFDDIFEAAPQTDEFDKEAWAAKKKAERDEVYALADATAEAVCADGSKFRNYLDVQATFRNYSATNALLILATKPDARRLGDKDFWRDQGVYIKRQEFGRPIKIVETNGEYTRDDGSIGVSYNIKRVYDISQTTARARVPQAASHDARALLNALIYKRPAPVQSVDELPNGIDAVYDREQNAVFVRRGLSANDLFCGLSKALAQAELARTGEEFTLFDSFELDDLSYLNEVDRHYEQSELTEASLYDRAVHRPATVEESALQSMEYAQLHRAISELPEIQKRRLILYYFQGLTYEQIAEMEGCTKRAVKFSVDIAVEKLKKFFKNF